MLTLVGYAPKLLALVVGSACREASHDCGGTEADQYPPVPRAAGGQGISSRAHVADDGPEGHRHLVPGDVVRLLPHRRRDGAADPGRAGRARAAVPEQRAVQPAVHHARHDHAAALRHTDPVRVRELHRAAADRRPGRRLPAAERLLLLAVPVRRIDRAVQFCHPGRGRGLRVVRLHPAVGRRALAWRWRRLVDHGAGGQRSGHDPRWGQLHHHDRLHAGARHDHVPDADLHLEHLRHRIPDPARVPGAHRGVAEPGGGSALRCPRVRPGQRRHDPLAAPVLVLRPPRGLHRGVAVLRHRHRGDPGVRPQAAVRLQGHGVRDARDRRPVLGGVGAPHVRHRRGAAAVLLPDDVPDRGARPG